MTLEPCGGCQCEINPKAKACPYCGFKPEVIEVVEVKHTINSLVEERMSEGWRVAERRETDVVIERGEKIHHIPNILMTVFTLGLWSVIYGLNLLMGGLKRRRIELHKGEVREKRI